MGKRVMLFWHERWRSGEIVQETQRTFRVRFYINGRAKVTSVHKMDVSKRLREVGEVHQVTLDG